MRRKIITLLISLSALAAAPALPADASAAAHGALFRVQGSGHTLYLFGTLHVGLPDYFPLEPRIEAAIAHAGTVALEVDPRQDPATVAPIMQRYAALPAGARADDGMGAADRARVARALQKAHLDVGLMSVYKPWMLAILLALNEYTAQGYRTDLGVDAYIAGQARKASVPVRELESMAAQLALLDSMKPAEQRAFLLDTVDAMDSGKESREVREVVAAWAHADQAALEDIASRAEQDHTLAGRFMQEVLIEGRNPALADKLAAQLAQQGDSVGAIGVLHLVGAHSVPLLLKAKGLTVERIY